MRYYKHINYKDLKVNHRYYVYSNAQNYNRVSTFLRAGKKRLSFEYIEEDSNDNKKYITIEFNKSEIFIFNTIYDIE